MTKKNTIDRIRSARRGVSVAPTFAGGDRTRRASHSEHDTIAQRAKKDRLFSPRVGSSRISSTSHSSRRSESDVAGGDSSLLSA